MFVGKPAGRQGRLAAGARPGGATPGAGLQSVMLNSLMVQWLIGSQRKMKWIREDLVGKGS